MTKPSPAAFALALHVPDHRPSSPSDPPEPVLVRGAVYQPVWSFATGDWDFVDAAGVSLDDVVRKPTLEQLQMRMAAKVAVDAAVQRLIAEQGPRLAELQKEIDLRRRAFPYEDIDGQTRRLARRKQFEDERDAIIANYDPARQVRGPQSFAAPGPQSFAAPGPQSFAAPGPLPVATTAAPLHGPPAPQLNDPYAPDIVPDQGVQYGTHAGVSWSHEAVRASVGDAYAYNLRTISHQVANDLERLGRAGYTEIHVATGTHGTPGGALQAELTFLQEDSVSIQETMQRHPGLKIVTHDMGDPLQVAQFEALQARAAEMQLPGGATLAAFCYSRTRVLDPTEGEAGPIGTVEVLDPAPGAFLHGGVSAAFGVLAFYGGLHDPDRLGATLKLSGGTAQVVGGTTYVVGSTMESLPVARVGSVLGEFGGYVATAAVLYDFYRMLRASGPGGNRMSSYEALTTGFEETLQLAGLMFPQAAVAAVVFHYGVTPMTEKAAEISAPIFVGGVSQAYGIPESMVWGMHGNN